MDPQVRAAEGIFMSAKSAFQGVMVGDGDEGKAGFGG
jgi:hypothetical protein